MSCPQLADAADIHRSFLDRIEKGDRGGTPATRLKIARALGVDLAAITTQDVPQATPAPQAA